MMKKNRRSRDKKMQRLFVCVCARRVLVVCSCVVARAVCVCAVCVFCRARINQNKFGISACGAYYILHRRLGMWPLAAGH